MRDVVAARDGDETTDCALVDARGRTVAALRADTDCDAADVLRVPPSRDTTLWRSMLGCDVVERLRTATPD